MIKKRSNRSYEYNVQNKIFLVFLFLVGALYFRFMMVSIFPVVDGVNIDEFASERNTVKTKLEANRGIIYDQRGNILAINVSSYTVIAYLDASRTGSLPNPRHVTDKQVTAALLAPVLNMSVEDLLVLLNKDVYQVELGPGGRNVTELKKDEIVALQLPGIEFSATSKRYYPNGNFASYVLGYAKQYETITNNISEFNLVGELGIELKYNELLRGNDGYLEYQRDLEGYKIPDTPEIRIDPVDGSNIYLTLDATIQRLVEESIDKMDNGYGAKWVTLSVMDAKTGDILGTSSTPSFDPNIKDLTSYENPLVSYLYEPGSVMKTYSYMCAIDKGTYKGNELFYSNSFTSFDDTIYNWYKEGWGYINYDTGFKYSSNVGVANMMNNFIDKADLQACYQKFGFGAKTNLELPREFTGSIKFNYPIEVVTAGYGQGISTTPIQQLQGLTIIANNGKMLKPHIVSKIVDAMGHTTYNRVVEEGEQLVSTSTITKMKELMYNTVNDTKDKYTAGKGYYIPGYDIIGKTGTAQIYDSKLGEYVGENIYSFAGMFPKDDPQIIIYVATRSSGNALIVQNTKELIKNIATYLNIYSNDDNYSTIEEYPIANYINKNVSDLNINNNLKLTIIGNGTKVIKQSVEANNIMLTGERLILLTNGSEIKMPNIIGWSRADVISLLNILNIKYTINGYGYVTSQSINNNIIIKKDDELVITLEKKYDLDTKEE